MEFCRVGLTPSYRKSIAYVRLHFPAHVEETVAQADAICAGSFVFREHWEMERTHEPVVFPGEVDWACIPAGDIEWLYALNRHTIFVVLAKAWRFTGSAQYARRFVHLCENWLARVPLTDASRANTWRSLESGLRPENWLRALRLFSGCREVPEALVQNMLASLQVHRDYLVAANGAFQHLSNWGVLQDYGLLQAALALEDRPTAERALARLAEECAVQVFDDGSHWEQSPMYHCEVLHCFLNSLVLARQNKLFTPAAFEARVHSMAQALAVWCKPGGVLPCQSDSDAVDARDLLAQAAILFSDGTLKFCAGESLPLQTLWNLGDEALAAYAAVPCCAPQAPYSAALCDSGNYFLRSDNGPQANWLHLHCGCLGSGHGHADLLHIDLCAAGEDILIDSGRYTYVNTPLRRRLKLPAAHNTTRVDDTDFSVCTDSWGYGALAQPLKGEYKFTPEADYLSAAHLGYLALAGGSVLTARKVVFLKPDLYLIADEFYAQDAHTYEQYFHFPASGSISEISGGVQFTGAVARATMLFLGENLCVTRESAPCSAEYNALSSCTRVRVQRRAEGFHCFFTVIATGSGAPCSLSAQLLPVMRQKTGQPLSPEQAHGFELIKDGKRYVVLLAHGESISEVDLLEVGGHLGYGKAIVFSDTCPKGRCLAW